MEKPSTSRLSCGTSDYNAGLEMQSSELFFSFRVSKSVTVYCTQSFSPCFCGNFSDTTLWRVVLKAQVELLFELLFDLCF
jgi:hypothetical protein